MKHMRRVAAGLATVGLALVVLGAFGRVHPALDSVAVFRAPLAWGTLALCLLAWCLLGGRPRWLALGGALAMAAQTGALALAQRSDPPEPAGGGGVVLYQQNLLWNRQEDAAWLAAISSAGADVLTLQEVSAGNRDLLAALAPHYPVQQVCPFADVVGGVAVLSRWPAIRGTARCAHGMALIQVAGPEGPLWIGAVHLHWPWPFPQAEQAAALALVLQGLDGPVILAGDFNAVPWSWTVRYLTAAARGQRIGPQRPTFRLPPIGLGLTIDHIIAPAGWHGGVRVQPARGSDHAGLLARLSP